MLETPGLWMTMKQQLCRRTSLILQNMLCVLWVEEPEKEAAQALQSSEDH